MSTKLRILLLEDSPVDAELVLREVRGAGYEPKWKRVQTEQDYLGELEQDWEIILADYSLPQFTGLRALELLKARGLDIPFIVVSGTIGEDVAVAAMKAGANDYVMKNRLARLGLAVKRELRDAVERRERRRAENALRESEARYRAEVDSAHDAMVTIDTGGQIVGWNHGAEEVFQYPATEILGQPLLRILPPSGHAHFLADLQRIQAGESPLTVSRLVELAGLRKDGAVIPMEMSVSEWTEGGQRFFTATMRDITVRKRLEEVLRLQGAALTAAANGIVITDRYGTIVWVNPAFTSLTGYTFAEAVGKNPRDLVKSGQVARAVFEQMWSTILAGRVWHGELINRRKDGSLYPEEQTITPLCDASGLVTHFIAIKQDLTERVRAQEALAHSEKRFRALIERAQDGISLLGPDGKVAYASPSTLRILGIAPEEAIGLDPKEYTHRDDLGPFLIQLTKLLQQPGGSFTAQYRFRNKTGSWRWLESTVSNLLAEPAVGAVVFNYRDITERKQIELELQHSEERYRLLFERNPLPMWLCDAQNLRFLAVNESAVQQYGYTREEFLAMTIESIRPPEDVSALNQFLQAERTEGVRVRESRHRRKDGTIIHVEIVSRPLVFEGREARLVLAADITEKKQLEQKFLQAQRLESLGMLAAGITHDLNNVLAPIVFAAPLLRTRLTDPRDVRILDTLESSAARGSGLVKQILGFVQLTAGEYQPVQAKHLLRDVISLIEETFPKAIQCDHHIPSDLWPVSGNATQIHQVLLNLCVNARDAMPEGGTLSITATNRRLDAAAAAAIAGARPGAWLLIEVSDTGTGIAPELLEKIWLPFFTTKGPDRGTGLGLATVRGIVASHHGFVELDTQIGRGTLFRVWLPALESEANVASGDMSSESPRGHGELILVVDDDSAVREIVAVCLEDNGYRVLACHDGLEALDVFMANPTGIALVLTDVDMPRMGGKALIEAVLGIRPEIPLVVMSGLTSKATGRATVPEIRKMTQAFLTKPFKNSELLETVHRLLVLPAAQKA